MPQKFFAKWCEHFVLFRSGTTPYRRVYQSLDNTVPEAIYRSSSWVSLAPLNAVCKAQLKFLFACNQLNRTLDTSMNVYICDMCACVYVCACVRTKSYVQYMYVLSFKDSLRVACDWRSLVPEFPIPGKPCSTDLCLQESLVKEQLLNINTNKHRCL